MVLNDPFERNRGWSFKCGTMQWRNDEFYFKCWWNRWSRLVAMNYIYSGAGKVAFDFVGMSGLSVDNTFSI